MDLVDAGPDWCRGFDFQIGFLTLLPSYGLTGHPNILAATLAVVTLLLLPYTQRLRRMNLVILTAVLCIASLGLATTFSRTAWLAFGLAAVAWVVMEVKTRGKNGQPLLSRWGQVMALALPAILSLLFLFSYRDLLISRVADPQVSQSETISVTERRRDVIIALQLISDKPVFGVGLGNFRPAARQIDARAYIGHNIPLLTMAEVGVFGGVMWLWLTVAGFWFSRRGPPHAFAGWLIPTLIAVFDATLWMTTSVRAVLMGILVAAVSLAEISEDVMT
ncbi:MAG: O-antigen ligase family protein [Chloroflexi bacterium]|nr:O-antigen ligase family protein [Chloroflexota bacterium]